MNILVINADCVTKNSSANLCHLAYIKGLVELGHNVTLISADGKDYIVDDNMHIPSEVNCKYYYGVSWYEKLSLKKNSFADSNNSGSFTEVPKKEVVSVKTKIISKVKRKVLAMYGAHGIYATFVRKAKSFKSNINYDFVISISTPPASHLLAHSLLKSGNVKANQWIQIWEDPWYSDAYGFNGERKIFEEERRLLSYTEKVCYVSPLTLKNQKRLYPESADKMYWQPLPYYYKDEVSQKRTFKKNVYGYFGDYVPEARNLEPFYLAAKKTGIEVNICGNPNGLFASTDNIHIYPRLTLEKLKPIEDRANVLIFLCNRKGGQIPGKIYQYSATDKTVLFIMDGTEEEQETLKAFFEPFNRYVFCNNTVEDITRAIKSIEADDIGAVKNEPLDAFEPKETIRKILEGVQ